MIRSVEATANDSIFCGFLGQTAVDAGMAGKTNMVVGTWNDEFVYIPVNLVVAGRKRLDLRGKLWASVSGSHGPDCANKRAGLRSLRCFSGLPMRVHFFRSNHSKARFKECCTQTAAYENLAGNFFPDACVLVLD